MDSGLIWFLASLAVLVLGFFLGAHWSKKSLEQKLGNFKTLSDKMIQDAKRDAANIKKEAHLQGQDLVFKMKNECERELSEKRLEHKRQEERLSQKEAGLDRRSESLAQREAEAARNEAELVKSEKANADRAQ